MAESKTAKAERNAREAREKADKVEADASAAGRNRNDGDGNDDVATPGRFAEKRSKAGVELLAGSESTRAEWEASPDGKAFLDDIAPAREKQAEAEVALAEAQADESNDSAQELVDYAGKVEEQSKQNREDKTDAENKRSESGSSDYRNS